MSNPFQINFSTQKSAKATQVSYPAELSLALNQLGLPLGCSTLVLVGGASGLDAETMAQLRYLFVDVLAPLAEALGLVVVDGGTEAGVMQLMGQARTQIAGTFPLVGVAAIGTVIFPHLSPPSSEAAPLEPHHSHFVFVPGNLWGDESPWIARVASTIASGTSSVTVLINGGKIAFLDVTYSVKAHRPVIVIAGSGRTADTLAAMLRGEANPESGDRLTTSGLLQAVNLDDAPEQLAMVIQNLLHKTAQTTG